MGFEGDWIKLPRLRTATDQLELADIFGSSQVLLMVQFVVEIITTL
jgi:hypothetical protein